MPGSCMSHHRIKGTSTLDKDENLNKFDCWSEHRMQRKWLQSMIPNAVQHQKLPEVNDAERLLHLTSEVCIKKAANDARKDDPNWRSCLPQFSSSIHLEFKNIVGQVHKCSFQGGTWNNVELATVEVKKFAGDSGQNLLVSGFRLDSPAGTESS